MGSGEPVPGLQVEPALGGPGRARIEPGHLAPHRAVQEERQPHRDLEVVPLGGRQRAGRVGQIPVGHGPVSAASRLLLGEQQVARAAGAQQRGLLEVGHVAVLGRDRRGAHLALLRGGGGGIGLAGLRQAGLRQGRAATGRAAAEQPQPGGPPGRSWPQADRSPGRTFAGQRHQSRPRHLRHGHPHALAVGQQGQRVEVHRRVVKPAARQPHVVTRFASRAGQQLPVEDPVGQRGAAGRAGVTVGVERAADRADQYRQAARRGRDRPGARRPDVGQADPADLASAGLRGTARARRATGTCGVSRGAGREPDREPPVAAGRSAAARAQAAESCPPRRPHRPQAPRPAPLR